MFFTYLGAFFEPLGDLAEKFDTMQSATAAGEKILLLFNVSDARELPVVQESSAKVEAVLPVFGGPQMNVLGERQLGFPGGDIRFEDVWFAYKPGEWVLRGVSFSIEKNRTLAIVGETGSVKRPLPACLRGFICRSRGLFQ